jgi:hypothetical protein
VKITYYDKYLNDDNTLVRSKHFEYVIGIVSFGSFIILIGVISVLTPSLFGKIEDFFRDFHLTKLPHTQNVFLPAPADPGAHLALYNAVGLFCLLWGSFQILVLVFRLLLNLSTVSKARTVSDIIFWLGSYYLISVFLNGTLTLTSWFAFWATIIILLGISLLARAILLAFSSHI